MKKLIYIFLLLFSLKSMARNYYISSSGNDANSGLTPQTPWKTLAKANASYILMGLGDSILVKRGDTLYGALKANKGDLNYGAYGTGSKPLIIGYTKINSWTNTGGGIYTANVPNAKSFTNLVVIDGEPCELARYPNSDATNKGWLTYTGFTDTTKLSGVVDGAWAGGEVVFKPIDWIVQRADVTAFSEGVLSYRRNQKFYIGNGSSNVMTFPKAGAGFGYFLQNKLAYVDKYKEWYISPTKQLSFYFGTETPSNHTVYIGTLDTAFNFNNKPNVTLQDIDFEGFNLLAVLGVYNAGVGNISIKNCSFKNIGGQAIGLYRVTNVTITNNKIDNCLNQGMSIICPQVNNINITSNRVTNIGQILGLMCLNQASDGDGIAASALSNLNIQGNFVSKTGIDCYRFQGSNVDVSYNWGDSGCMSAQDHAIVYTYHEAGANFINRKIHHNFFSSPVGTPEGTPSSVRRANLIYTDGTSNNIEIYNNTLWNVIRSGMNLNSPSNVYVHDNTIVLNSTSLATRCIAFNQINADVIRDLRITNNILYMFAPTQSIFAYTAGNANVPITTSIQANIQAIGVIDSNKVNYENALAWDVEYYTPKLNPPPAGQFNTLAYSLSQWKNFTGFDQNTTILPTQKIDSIEFKTNWSAFNGATFLRNNYITPLNLTSPISGNIILPPYSNFLAFFYSRNIIMGNKIISNKVPKIKVL